MAKTLPNPEPFTEYTVYGPYLDRKQDRQIVALMSPGHRTTMSYARYLLSIREGFIPDRGIEADHVDNDRTNNDPGNIQPLPRAENVRKGRKPPAMVTLVCGGCGESFTRRRNKTHLVKGGIFPSCCSRKCARALRSGRGVQDAPSVGRDVEALL